MKRNPKSDLLTAACLSVLFGHLPAQQIVPIVEQTPAVSGERATSRLVDLAICLDTSGSMDGLIDSARQGIWAIVNDLALATPTPKLRVALLTFGNDGHDPTAGWVRVNVGFTEDLDRISQELFALTTNGGTELVGRVVQSAVNQLEWTVDAQALKLIVVAGNESADQDREVRYTDACGAAIGKGIQINAIYCGDPNDQIAPAWRDVAKLADGRFHAIDKDTTHVAIATPFDDQLAALNVELNRTYLPFGSDGNRGWVNQTAQDENAESCSDQVKLARIQTKATTNYCNPAWDLVDACRMQTVKLAEIADAELPEALRGKSVEEKQQIVERLATRRAEVQAQVLQLSQQRDAAVVKELAARAIDTSNSFDSAVRGAVRAQAAARGIEVKAPPASVPATDASVAPGGDAVNTGSTVTPAPTTSAPTAPTPAPPVPASPNSGSPESVVPTPATPSVEQPAPGAPAPGNSAGQTSCGGALAEPVQAWLPLVLRC